MATTLMIGVGIDLKTVQEICGHKSIMTTMNYTHLLSENLKQVAKSISIKPVGVPASKTGLRVVRG